MSKALVILSGGQDSTTCLAIASKQYEEVHAVTFNYGQRHKIEIESAVKVAEMSGVASHEIIDMGSILKGRSPLVSDNKVGQYESVDELPDGVEPTFVEGRNLLFLTIAANRAAVIGITDIFMGVCEEDFAGYWDCRQKFIDATAIALGEAIYGTSDKFKIHTPLMNLTKAQSVHLAVETLGDRFGEVFLNTHTCYDGVSGGCGKCHACILRDRGFKDAGIADPIWALRC
jgi:7-cyano-7-deazaguanine synthase